MALGGREPDVVALQEVTARTLPLWRAACATLGLAHVACSLEGAAPAREPAGRRRTGVLLAAREPLDPLGGLLPVPWPETALAVRVAGVEVHTVHVPNAANGEIKPQTLAAVRAGLATRSGPRVLCGDLNTPRREAPDGTVWSFARDGRGRLRPERAGAWDAAELGVVPGLRDLGFTDAFRARQRLGRARAELDVAADRRPRRRLAARPRLLRRARARRVRLPPRLARGRSQRPLGAGGGSRCRPTARGYASPMSYAITNLREVEDMAAKHGFGELQASRFPRTDVGMEDSGLAYHAVKPGKQQPFGHRHKTAEEIHVIISGSGRVKLDDELVDVGEMDVIRVAPEVTRAFEAGPDGLEYLVFSPRRENDADMVQDVWES